MNEANSSADVIETRASKFWLNDQQLIMQEFKPNTNLDIEGAKENLATMITLAKKQPVYLCAILNNLKSADRESRALGASPEYSKAMGGIAMITQSAMARVIGSFFMRFNKPSYPVKMFGTQKEATLPPTEQGQA